MRSVKIKEVVDALERFAPLPLQESYDNAGLQVGLTEAEVSGALLCLDVTENIVDEAVRRGCNLIVAHHPLIFRKLAQVSDADYVQRTVMKAVKNDIAIVAMHTNLDSAVGGVNYKIAEKLGLEDVSGAFLLHDAVEAGADAFVTGEMGYHEFFGHEQEIQLCVIGHYQSEQYTVEVFRDVISRDCPGVKCLLSEVNTNPIVYF